MNLATRMSGNRTAPRHWPPAAAGPVSSAAPSPGLTTAGLQLTDGTDNLTLGAGSTTFTFPTLLTDGTAYVVQRRDAAGRPFLHRGQRLRNGEFIHAERQTSR